MTGLFRNTKLGILKNLLSIFESALEQEKKDYERNKFID